MARLNNETIGSNTATITSIPTSTGTIANFSGIGYQDGNAGKANNLYALLGVREVDGYRERWSPIDGEVARVFDVPWQNRKQFVDITLGFAENYASLADFGSDATYNPTGSGGTLSVGQFLAAGAQASALGSGYAIDDLITLSGGTFTRPAILRVEFLTGSNPELFTLTSIEDPGVYSVVPPNPVSQASTTGSGTGATFNMVWGMSGLSRIVPEQHPEYPWMYAVSVDQLDCIGAMGKNSAGTMVFYFDASSFTPPPNQSIQLRPGFARYKVTYKPLDYEIRTNEEMAAQGFNELARYVTRSETYAVQNVEVPNVDATRSLKFAEGPFGPNPGPAILVPFNAILKLVPTKEVTWVWHQVPDVPEDAISLCQGKVNDAAFDPSVLYNGTVLMGGVYPGGYPAETLLMQTPNKERKRTVMGRVCWEITYKALYRPQGWNHFLASDGQWWLATYGGALTGQTVYQLTDFNTLFTEPLPRQYQNDQA